MPFNTSWWLTEKLAVSAKIKIHQPYHQRIHYFIMYVCQNEIFQRIIPIANGIHFYERYVKKNKQYFI